MPLTFILSAIAMPLVSTPSAVDAKIRAVGGWRAELLAKLRQLILEVLPDAEERCQWIKPSNPLGVPCWSHHGLICTGESYKSTVKLTFARGAFLDDPSGLFNASLTGGTRRAIDITEHHTLDEVAFRALVKAAAAENLRRQKPKRPQTPPR